MEAVFGVAVCSVTRKIVGALVQVEASGVAGGSVIRKSIVRALVQVEASGVAGGSVTGGSVTGKIIVV